MSFANPFAPRRRAISDELDRVKALARRVLDLPDDTAVTVSEVVCRDPGCPGLETVILVLPPGGPTRLLRIPGSLSAVIAADLAAWRDLG